MSVTDVLLPEARWLARHMARCHPDTTGDALVAAAEAMTPDADACLTLVLNDDELRTQVATFARTLVADRLAELAEPSARCGRGV